MHNTTFQKGMAYLSAAYGTELSRERLAVYWDQLAYMGDDAFLATTKAHVASRPRFPAVSELRDTYSQRCQMQARVHRLSRPRRVDEDHARDVLKSLKTQLKGVQP